MRSQRRAPLTVTLTKATTLADTDDLGNRPGDPEAPETVEIPGAILEPQRILEQTGSDQVPIVRPAYWNLPGVYDVDADDTITDPAGATWLVTGGGIVWLDRTKVPVTQPRSV